MNEARKALEKEVDILEMIKSRRFFHIALRHLLKPALHEEFEARSKFFEINTDQQHSGETVQISPKQADEQEDNDLNFSEVREEQARVNNNNVPVSKLK